MTDPTPKLTRATARRHRRHTLEAQFAALHGGARRNWSRGYLFFCAFTWVDLGRLCLFMGIAAGYFVAEGKPGHSPVLLWLIFVLLAGFSADGDRLHQQSGFI